MELRLKNGDYIPDGKGGVVRLSGDNALLQRVLFRLSARRGALPMLPELGSQLYLLGREAPEASTPPRRWPRRGCGWRICGSRSGGTDGWI